jgi:hypothetical protein
MRFALSTLAVIAVARWAALCPAAEPSPGPVSAEKDARRLFREGLAHADAARWTEASECFARAHALRPTPQIAYDLSMALVQLGQLVRASHLLSSITEATDARPAVREAARVRLAEVRPRLARLTVEASAIDRQHLWLDAKALDTAASAASMPVDPGTHILELRFASGAVISRTVSVGEGADQTIIFQPTRSPIAGSNGLLRTMDLDPSPPAADSVLRKTWFWGVVGTVVLASAAVLLVSRAGAAEVHGNVDTWTLPR